MATDTQQSREERELTEREEDAQKQWKEARRKELHTQQMREWQKIHVRTDRIGTEMDTETEGEAGSSQLHSRDKKGHMTNIYLMESDGEAIMDFEEP